ncbi:MAG: hypothetical protein ACHQ1G_08510 [Planctomycetota bacterium]
MDPSLRERFNAAWSEGLYRAVREDLERRLSCRVPFRVAETPLFFPADFRERFGRAANEIVAQLSDPRWISAQEEAVPKAYAAPRRPALPQVAQVDFAIVREKDGSLGPRLVELQGFPSLYGFQILLSDVWTEHLATIDGMPDAWRIFFGGFERARAMGLIRETLLHGHDPEQVILLDLDPDTQKTYPDFRATHRWWGVEPVCLTSIRREGRSLYREKDGRRIPVKRVFQRVVFDELERTKLPRTFDFHEDLDVEWAPHPAWYFLWSKRSMLSLDHWAVPKTRLVSAGVPKDLSCHVLKPLYSFAGGGVKVDPTAGDVAEIPAADRDKWILQEKVEYAPAFKSVHGDPVKAEVRMMFVRPDEQPKMTLLMSLLRLSRGKMMGVNFNKDLDWVGASVGVWPA